MTQLKQIIYHNMEHKIITYPGVCSNRYVITEYGHIIELKPYLTHIKAPFVNTYGYLQISIKNNQNITIVPLVHRLVAWEWLYETRDIALTVDHLDCNKLNNHYSNLQWVTNSENRRRAYLNGLCKLQHHDALKSINDIHKVCYLLSTTDLPYKDICNIAGLTQLNENQAKGLCCDILDGLYWKDISSQYDFSIRKMNRRKYLSPEIKELMYQLYLNNTSYEDIYKYIYNIIPCKKQLLSFNRVMQRIIKNHESSSTNL